MPGTLYIIGTPIGNLSDLSQRAIETLRSVELLYCEDTRVTGKLTGLIGSSARLRRLSDDSEARAWDAVIDEVRAGKAVGFATDAGMPGISDPARRLTRTAWSAGIVPVVIPGPSAVPTLLAACPFVSGPFSFLGFAPRKDGERARFADQLLKSPLPGVFFESPRRVHSLLDAVCSVLEPGRELLIGREMTKLHEQLVLFTAGQWLGDPALRASIPELGEFSVAVAGREETAQPVDAAQALAALERLTSAGFSRRDAVRALGAALDLPANELKRIAYDGPER
jgi:16S rRNA (cytidine1402-2'-O)-methyltransferase